MFGEVGNAKWTCFPLQMSPRMRLRAEKVQIGHLWQINRLFSLGNFMWLQLFCFSKLWAQIFRDFKPGPNSFISGDFSCKSISGGGTTIGFVGYKLWKWVREWSWWETRKVTSLVNIDTLWGLLKYLQLFCFSKLCVEIFRDWSTGSNSSMGPFFVDSSPVGYHYRFC